MSDIFSDLSNQIAVNVDHVSASVVQVHGHHRPTAGVVVAPELVLAPSRALGDDTVVVRDTSGEPVEAGVVAHASQLGLAVVRAPGLKAPAAAAGAEPRVGELAVAVGRTWSGGVMASVTNVAVVGGPLRTGRTAQIDRVIRIAHEPHGALTGGALMNGHGQVVGLVTGAAIRGTTVVVPAGIAFPLATTLAADGSATQGFIGIGSTAVDIPGHQRGHHAHERGLLVTSVVSDGPAAAAGLFVGDILVEFGGKPVDGPETLLGLLRGNLVGSAVTATLLRGVKLEHVAITVSERPRSEPRRRRGR